LPTTPLNVAKFGSTCPPIERTRRGEGGNASTLVAKAIADYASS
jgi:hypothetical protein